MRDNLAIGETKGFQNRDLFPLQRQKPRKHGVGHERRHAQKHDRKPNRERVQNADFIRDPDVRRVIAASIGAASAIRSEETIDLGDDGAFGGAGREREGKVVESPIEVEGRGQFLVRHPEKTVSAVVRQRRAGTGFEDEFRREHDARDAEVLAAAIEQHGDAVAGPETIGLGEGLAHQHLAAAARSEPSARAETGG